MVYNLEFPTWITEVTIADHHFVRVHDYLERIKRLNRLLPIQTDEVSLPATIGTHMVTATCEAPDGMSSVLEASPAAAIQDITQLLGLFTSRDVCVADREYTDIPALIVRDVRQARWGGTLRSSLHTTRMIPAPPPLLDLGQITVDTSLEGLNHVYALMRTPSWKRQYRNGWLLKLARDAFWEYQLELAFVRCWTLWEHLYAILNPHLTEKQVSNVFARDKIAFVLQHYALQPKLDKTSSTRIQDIANIRNRLIHYGRFPVGPKAEHLAETFVRATEFVVAKILGLVAPDIYGSMKGFEQHLFPTENDAESGS